MNTKYKVTAQSFDRYTGEPTGLARDEVIDTKSNELFKTVKFSSEGTKLLAVKRIYETFWNELNHNSAEIVFVREIKPL